MGYGCKAYGSWTNSAKDELEWTPPYEIDSYCIIRVWWDCTIRLTWTAPEEFGETTKISTQDARGEFGWTPTSGLTQVAEEEFLWNSALRF